LDLLIFIEIRQSTIRFTHLDAIKLMSGNENILSDLPGCSLIRGNAVSQGIYRKPYSRYN
jgi:hypothetical protein